MTTSHKDLVRWTDFIMLRADLLGVGLLLVGCGGMESHSPAPGIPDAPGDASRGAMSETAGPTTDSGDTVVEAAAVGVREAGAAGTVGRSDDGGDGASTGNGDGALGTDAGPSLCTAGQARCSGKKTVESCDANGVWQIGLTCECSCLGGSCFATCVPGTRQCIGTTPYWCDPATCTWGPQGPACPSACVNGECDGVCVPGAKQCNGVVPQICNAVGSWSDTAPCPAVCLRGVCASP